mmetsp:Transcript_63232/g.117647  ORF Transcript_63232/g.117647 Transcript_63232/m.117647 type:complete len:152 (+) Transcript_63232:783-1238(+)
MGLGTPQATGAATRTFQAPKQASVTAMATAFEILEIQHLLVLQLRDPARRHAVRRCYHGCSSSAANPDHSSTSGAPTRSEWQRSRRTEGGASGPSSDRSSRPPWNKIVLWCPSAPPRQPRQVERREGGHLPSKNDSRCRQAEGKVDQGDVE